ncbi:MAG: lamin tail domain-containing protein [Bacteroidetes bacterium]|nr:lamin tail domain-containing protein [Bacteroidota bacterium]
MKKYLLLLATTFSVSVAFASQNQINCNFQKTAFSEVATLSNFILGEATNDETTKVKLWISSWFPWINNNIAGDPGVFDIAGGYTVAITEINYNSDNFNDSNAWVELHNYGGSDVNISNWKLKDETPFNSYTIPVGTILSPDEYIVIVQSIDTFLMVHGDVTNYIGEFGYGFDNTSGSVKLEDNSGTVVRLVNYVDSIPWPKGADGLGPALQILDETGNENDPDNWIASCVLGTPGFDYTPCDYDIVISEINYNSLLAYNPGDWVEILNRGSSAINIGGWILRDANTGNIYVIPTGNILDAGERLVVTDSLESFTVKFPSITNVIGEPTFHFSNGGDGVRLYTPSGLIKYSVRYNDNAPWPTDADGTGFTLEQIDEGGNPNIATTWVAGCLYGSPGNPFVVPCPTAIEELYPTFFTIAPNPFSEQLIITIDATINVKDIYITNSLGQNIKHFDNSNNIITWNGNDENGNTVPVGVYLITVSDEMGNLSSMRVVRK